MKNSELITLLETMFHKAYIQGRIDSSEGIHICSKQLYKQFLEENSSFFVASTNSRQLVNNSI